jgi:hypothetical protein
MLDDVLFRRREIGGLVEIAELSDVSHRAQLEAPQETCHHGKCQYSLLERGALKLRQEAEHFKEEFHRVYGQRQSLPFMRENGTKPPTNPRRVSRLRFHTVFEERRIDVGCATLDLLSNGGGKQNIANMRIIGHRGLHALKPSSTGPGNHIIVAVGPTPAKRLN